MQLNFISVSMSETSKHASQQQGTKHVPNVTIDTKYVWMEKTKNRFR